MMKKILFFLMKVVLIGNVFAYMPTVQDQAIMGIIESKIDELSLVQATQISGLVGSIMETLEPDTKKYRFAQEILVYLDTGILAIPEVVVGPAVVDGDTVMVDYIGTLVDGTVFDTSVMQVAKDAGLYNEMRSYEPLGFRVGDGTMISGFDRGVVGMREGETKTIYIPPEDAYGYGNHPLAGETLVFEVTVVSIDE